MSIITLLIVLLVLGLVWYLIGLLPIDAKIKKIIQVIFIVICILWLLSLVFGNLGIANYRI